MKKQSALARSLARAVAVLALAHVPAETRWPGPWGGPVTRYFVAPQRRKQAQWKREQKGVPRK